jgi:hypothetical protein
MSEGEQLMKGYLLLPCPMTTPEVLASNLVSKRLAMNADRA